MTSCDHVTPSSGVCGVGFAGSAFVHERQPGTDQKPAQHLMFLQPSLPSHGLPQLHHQGHFSSRTIVFEAAFDVLLYFLFVPVRVSAAEDSQ